MTTFLAFLNYRGIVCASDTDHTICSLVPDIPVVVAFPEKASFDWAGLILAYQDVSEGKLLHDFQDWVDDFIHYVESAWRAKGEVITGRDNIFMLGYGKNDILPSWADVLVGLDFSSGEIEVECDIQHICRSNPTGFLYFEPISEIESIIAGIKAEAKQKIFAEYKKLYQSYIKRIEKKVKGTVYEAVIQDSIEDYDVNLELSDVVDDIGSEHLRNFHHAIKTMDIEDLIKKIETIINLKALFHSGGHSKNQTRELAVITSSEGLVWVKHSKYGLIEVQETE